MKWVLFLIFALLAVGFYLIWKNVTVPEGLGVIRGRLASCPNKPNCVNSYATHTKQYIPPLAFHKIESLELIVKLLQEREDISIIKQTGHYLHVVVRTPKMRFRDDLEFLVDEKKLLIHMRSGSRLGYWDMGANRKRLEQLREDFTFMTEE